MPKLHPARILLIVDDDRGIRDMVAARLEHAGYETDQAADRAQALLRLQQHRIDVVLLDVGLPRMSGLDCPRANAHPTHTAACGDDDGR